jgi:hypothetical protein
MRNKKNQNKKLIKSHFLLIVINQAIAVGINPLKNQIAKDASKTGVAA